MKISKTGRVSGSDGCIFKKCNMKNGSSPRGKKYWERRSRKVIKKRFQGIGSRVFDRFKGLEPSDLRNWQSLKQNPRDTAKYE